MSSYGIVEVSHSEEVETPQGVSLKGTPHLRSIDMRDFKKWLAEIYPRRHTLISKLNYSENIILESIKSTLNQLIHTNQYAECYQLIVDKFGDGREEYYPGTVGSLLMGCYRYKSSDLGACHPSCVGMVQPSSGAVDLCKTTVINAYWIDHQYHFSVAYYGGTTQAIIYFERFHGLTPGEIESLRQKGVSQVKLYEYGVMEPSWSEQRIRAITPDFVVLDAIPRRSVNSVVECSQLPDGMPKQYWVLFIIVLILVIVITAIITYLITKNAKRE